MEPFQKTFDQTGTFRGAVRMPTVANSQRLQLQQHLSRRASGRDEGRLRNREMEEPHPGGSAELHGTVDGDFREGPGVAAEGWLRAPQANGVAA